MELYIVKGNPTIKGVITMAIGCFPKDYILDALGKGINNKLENQETHGQKYSPLYYQALDLRAVLESNMPAREKLSRYLGLLRD